MSRLTLPVLLVLLAHSAVDARESKLFRSLTGRSESVRMRTIAAVDPLRQEDLLPDVIAAARHHANEVEAGELLRPSSVALLYLVGRFEHVSSEELLTELLDSEHSGISMVAADSLGKNKRHGAIDALKEQVKRNEFLESYGFRFNLVRALAQMEHPEAVEFLTELGAKIDGQLRFQLEKVLDDVTVNYFFGDEERFEQWQQEREKATEQLSSGGDDLGGFFTAGYEPDSANRIKFEPPKYYGIDIHARRLMFIIDHSGSMKEYWGGYTRLDRAKFELIRAIEELPESTEFAIAFYESRVRLWREELVLATTSNKREAIKFVNRLGYGDKTNTYGALRQSLEFDDELEAVFLLTDGRPTVGNLIAPAQIVTDIIHRNRFRHLNFNTIGIAVQGRTQTFLRTLAEQSNGEFRTADWER